MKKRIISPVTYFLVFAALVLFALHWRLMPNKRYALVFLYQSENCAINDCPVDKKISIDKQLIFHDPLNSRAYSDLAGFYASKKDEQAALKLHQKAITLDHENGDSYLWLGTYFLRQNDLEAAFRYLNHMDQFTDRDPTVSHYLAMVHEKLGHKDKAFRYQAIARQGLVNR